MATAVIKITETYTADSGANFNTELDYSIANISDVVAFERNVGTSVETIVEVGSGKEIENLVALRVTNLDPTNFVTVGLLSASDTVYHKIPAGGHLVVSSDEIDANTAGGAFAAFVTITSVTAAFDTAAGNINVKAYGV